VVLFSLLMINSVLDLASIFMEVRLRLLLSDVTVVG